MASTVFEHEAREAKAKAIVDEVVQKVLDMDLPVALVTDEVLIIGAQLAEARAARREFRPPSAETLEVARRQLGNRIADIKRYAARTVQQDVDEFAAMGMP